VFHYILKLCYFLKRNRGSGLAFYATNALAGLKVATELLSDNIRRK
jgi:hypothetical protein